MAISTYSELKTAIGTWINNDEVTAYIADIIRSAEDLIAYGTELPNGKVIKGIRCLDMMTRVTTTLTGEYTDLPTNYLEIRNIQMNSDPVVDLDYMTPEAMDKLLTTAGAGSPRYYTIIGDTLQVKPVPSSSELEIAYFAKYNAMTADADTNWLLINHPFIYLKAALYEAHTLLHSYDEAERALSAYSGLANGINRTTEKGRRGESRITRVFGSTP